MTNQNLVHLRSLIVSFFILCLSLSAMAQDHRRCSCDPLIFCENFTIYTKHQIEGHPVFDRVMPVDTGCANTEFYPTVKVTADGSQATIIEVENVKCNCGTLNANARIFLEQRDINGNPVGNSQPDDYGGFIFEGFSGQTSTFRYQHPKRIPDPGMNTIFFVHIYQQAPTDNYGGFWIEVHRPPVVFIHGLWSDESAFDKMDNILLNTGDYEDYQLFKADYSSSNAASIGYNDLVMRNAVTQIIDNCLYHGLSVGKVNIVAHSMGGLLARQYLEAPYYASRHDVNRVITCNTPHAGSQMANFLLDSTLYSNIISRFLGMAGMDCYGGAVDNLRVNSGQIADIELLAQPPDLYYHSLVTTSDPNKSIKLFTALMSTVNINGVILFLMSQCGGAFIEDVFDQDDNDAIVAAESQAGGLGSSGLNTTLITNQVHMGSVSNNMVIMNIRSLLNEPYTSNKYAQIYPAFFLTYSLGAPCVPVGNGDGGDHRNGGYAVHIVSPTSGTMVTGGQTMTVSYTSSEVDSVVVAMRFHPDSMAIIANSAAAGKVDFVVPKNLIGHYPLIAMGFGTDKKLKAIDSTHLNIVTTATLTKLTVYPNVMYLAQQDSIPFTITGVYDDGIRRNLTHDAGLTFDFSLGYASRTSTSFIRLDSAYSDTLRVHLGSIGSLPVLLQHVTGEPPPPTFICGDHLSAGGCLDTIPSNATLVMPQLDTDDGNNCFFVCSNSILNLTDNPNGPHGDNNIYVNSFGTVNIESGENHIVAKAPSTVNLLPGSDGTTVNCESGVIVIQNGVQIFPCSCDSIVFDYSFFGSACTVDPVVELPAEKNELKVFPVPATDLVTIVLENGTVPINGLQIWNTEGKMVVTRSGPQYRFDIDVSTFTAGIYFIRARIKGDVVVKKFIVM